MPASSRAGKARADVRRSEQQRLFGRVVVRRDDQASALLGNRQSRAFSAVTDDLSEMCWSVIMG